MLKIIVLSENSKFLKDVYKILNDESEFFLYSFLTSEFFTNIDNYSVIIKESNIIILDIENFYFKIEIFSLIDLILSLNPKILIISVSNFENKTKAIETLNHGAFYYLLFPLTKQELLSIILKCKKFIECNNEYKILEEQSNIFEEKLNSLTSLFNLRTLINSRYVLEKFFYMIIDTIISTIKCDKCSILLLDDKNGDILVQSNKNQRIYKRGPATLNVIQTKVPQIIENIKLDKRFKSIKQKAKYKTNSFLNVPIFLEDKLIAIINVTDKIDGTEFTVDDLEKIRGICNHVQNFILKNKEEFNYFLANDYESILTNIQNEKNKLKKVIIQLDKELTKVKSELIARKNELETLYSMGKILKTTFSVSDLLKMIVDVIKQTMDCQRVSVLWIDDIKGDILVKGKIGKKEKEVENLLIKKRGFVTNYILNEKHSLLYPSEEFNADLPLYKKFSLYNKTRGYKTSSFIATPILVKDKVVAIINITDKISGETFNNEDLKKIEFIANQLSTAIENFKLSENLLEKERLAKELEIAHRIQAKLLPKVAIEIPNLEVFVINYSALEMGGDYYDFIKISDNLYGICIGDIAGKGIPASLQMMILRTLFKHISPNETEPKELINKLNKQISNDLENDSFVAFSYCIYNTLDQTITFSNAGNCFPAHYISATNEIKQIELPGLLLGVSSDYNYQQISIKLQPNDIIALYTDGIFDVLNDKKEIWGEKNLLNEFKKLAHHSPAEIAEGIMQQITNFKGTEKQFDDMTLIIIKVKQ